ncbi:hypothetical protein [uncultured Sphingomonas sp.]|uniref:hypothetical protein n=1 Tax=uncultured Sphingomonas sp. TaxID=158754 RepID=UPI0025DCCC55|nr:hypothetical protein [uncultured Sphingomonas sp.]
MTDDQLDNYAVSLANAAMVSTTDAIEAATVLFQASAAVIATQFGPAQVAPMLRRISEEFEQEVGGLGLGETRQ